MAEYTAAAAQTVANGNNVLFTATPVCATRCIVHREGAGIVTLRGITNGQCRARFRVNFGGNIAIPTALPELSLLHLQSQVRRFRLLPPSSPLQQRRSTRTSASTPLWTFRRGAAQPSASKIPLALILTCRTPT